MGERQSANLFRVSLSLSSCSLLGYWRVFASSVELFLLVLRAFSILLLCN